MPPKGRHLSETNGFLANGDFQPDVRDLSILLEELGLSHRLPMLALLSKHESGRSSHQISTQTYRNRNIGISQVREMLERLYYGNLITVNGGTGNIDTVYESTEHPSFRSLLQKLSRRFNPERRDRMPSTGKLDFGRARTVMTALSDKGRQQIVTALDVAGIPREEEDLSETCSLSGSQLSRRLDTLEDAELITRDGERVSLGRNKQNAYQMRRASEFF